MAAVFPATNGAAAHAPPMTVAPAAPGGAVAQIEAQRAVAEVQAMIFMARTNPRDEMRCLDKIQTAFTRPRLAEQAKYQYSKGGSEIDGPSIRSAEAIAQLWQNMSFGFKEVSRGRDPDGVTYSDVEAFAWDMENNTRRPLVFRVRHWRDTRKGGYKLTDEREIYELMANQAQRRVRSCILAIVPGDVIETAMAQADETLKTQVEVTPELIESLVAAFGKLDVTREQIEKRIQRRIDTITPAGVVQLKKVFNSIRDGVGRAEDFFDPVEEPAAAGSADAATSAAPQSGVEKAKAAMRQRTAKPEPQAQPAAAAPSAEQKPDAQPATTAKPAEESPIVYTFAQVADMISRATSIDTLDIAVDSIRFVDNPDHRQELTERATKRHAELSK